MPTETQCSIMKVAITGASGFIGRHLLLELERYPIQVFAITRNAGKLAQASKRTKVIEFDLNNYSGNPYELLGSPDLLIHLAWDRLSNYRDLYHFEVQLPVHFHFLQQMVHAGLTSIFVAGTCFEYGLQSGALSEEQYTRPVNSYAFAKDTLHKQLQLLQEQCPFHLTWGRLFYMYGDGQAPNSLYPQLMEAIKQNSTSFNMSGGEQLRDYLPVSEVAKLIARIALNKRGTGTINLCSGKPISVRRLVEQWIESSKRQITLNMGHYPYSEHEPLAFWGDRTLLDQELNAPEIVATFTSIITQT